MAPATQLALAVLTTSSVVLAARNGHAQHHIHKRQSRYPGTAPSAPFGYANGTSHYHPTGTGRSTHTKTNQVTATVYNTVTIPGSGSGDVPVDGAALPTCGGTVTVTNSVTVTVTGGADSSSTGDATSAPAPSAAPSSSEGVSPEAYPVTDTTFTARSAIPTVTVTSKVNAAGGHKSGGAPAPAKSSAAAPAPAPAKSSAAPAPNSYSPPAASSSAASSSAVSPPASSSGASKSSASSDGTDAKSKRGCLYQDTNNAGCQALAAAGVVSWTTNWAASPGAGVDSCTYQPQLWGAKDAGTFDAAAQSAISAGSTAVLGYNEPDRTDQAGMDATTTARDLWKAHIAPLSGKVTVVSPGVTSQVLGDGSIRGINWLKDFKGDASTGIDWDATGVHFYANCGNTNIGLENGGELSYLKKMVDAATAAFNKPVWVTEFGCYEGTPTDQIAALYTAAIPYLDGESNVHKYAGFKADLLASGSSVSDLNAAGKAYGGLN